MIAKALGELTGREFQWGLVASLAAPIIGDIFSSNAANSAQKQAQQNADDQTQRATQAQIAYLNHQAAQGRAAAANIASAGNPFLNAIDHAHQPNPQAYAMPGGGGQVFGGGSGVPQTLDPKMLASLYQQSGQNVLTPQAPPQGPTPQALQPHNVAPPQMRMLPTQMRTGAQ